MKRLIVISLCMLLLVGCSEKDITKESEIYESLIKQVNAETNDKEQVLADTIMNLLGIKREHRGYFVGAGVLLVVITAELDPKDEYEIFNEIDSDSALSLLNAFNVKAVYLRVVDSENIPIFEIDFEDGKTCMIGTEYIDILQ